MTTVQFDHRLLALSTFAMILLYWWRARRADLPARAAKASNALLHTAILQLTLGIATLVLKVPTLLAVLHQAIALLLFTVALLLLHDLRKVPM
jgi:cytochrome c oxidase assembly protein subunit 15